MLVGQVVAVDGTEGFVEAWIESDAEGMDGGDLHLAEDVFHMLDDEGDAGAELFGGSVGVEGELEVIEDGEELLDDGAGGVVLEVLALAFGAFAGVVKLRLEAGESIDELVTLGLELVKAGAGDGVRGSGFADWIGGGFLGGGAGGRLGGVQYS
jgi:hypothetical protein